MGKPSPPRPGCASAAVVSKFLQRQTCRPSPDTILMAWFQPLSSQWNQECLATLAEKALPQFKATAEQALADGKLTEVYDSSWLTIHYLIKSMSKSLVTTSKIMQASQPGASADISPSTSNNRQPQHTPAQPRTAAERTRRRSRKQRVCFLLFSLNVN